MRVKALAARRPLAALCIALGSSALSGAGLAACSNIPVGQIGEDGGQDAGIDVFVDSGMDGGSDAGTDGTMSDAPTTDGPATDGTLGDASMMDGAPSMDAAMDSGTPTDSTAPVDSGGDGEASDASEGGSVVDAYDAGMPCELDAGDAGPDGGGCPASFTCCSNICVDVTHDPRNCGACGNACTSTQFCNGTNCNAAVFANICNNPAATAVNDPFSLDQEAGISLGTALAACADAGNPLSIVSQTQAGILIPMGDAGSRPNTGVGNTFVAAGSWYGQLGVAYMDNSALTPVYFLNDGTTSRVYQRSTGIAVVTTADSALTSTHDYFILTLAVEPISGTLCFFGEGIFGQGTAAAGYYGSQVVVPNRSTYTDAWYVYEWTDGNSNSTPDNGDTYNLIAHGS